MTLLDHKKLENSEYEIKMSIDAAEFSAAVNKAYKSAVKTMNVPGFRKGKAPKHLVEKMYGKEIFYSDAINDVFGDNYEKAIEETGIEPVDRPSVDIESADETNGAVLVVNVTVMPEIEVGEYKGLKADKDDYTVTDGEIDERVEQVRERNSRLVTTEEAAKDTDTVVIDFEGFVDDVAFDGGKGEDFSLVLGSGQFIPGFEEQVVGHLTGDEFDVNVSFPEEYHAAELAGKPSVFKVKLKEIKAKEVPALDDEFAKDVSEFDTLAEYKDSIRKEIADSKEKQAELGVENALMEQIIGSVEGFIPAVMYDNRSNDMVREFEGRLQGQGLNLETYLKYMGRNLEEFKAGFAEEAEKQVKTRLALLKVAQLENITASDEDLDEEVKRIAEAYKMEADKIKELIPLEDVRKDLSLNKTLDFIKENAVITVNSSSN